MPWIKSLSGYGKWIISIGVLIAFLVLDQQVQSLKYQLSEAKGKLEAKELQFQTAQAFNDSLNATVQELNKVNADSHAAANWARKLNAAMAANLEKAKDDIGKLIDEATPSSTCSGTYSPDVYQRMLQFYGAGTEGDNSG
ncbi:TPA: hypothetical protein PMF73_002647 [Vibrio cholerae]|nr:hypothetical protein [Vibrio cholerae]